MTSPRPLPKPPCRWRTFGRSAAAALLLAWGAAAARADGLPLEDCIARALARSPELKASVHDIKAADYELRSAQGALFPQLSGSFTVETLKGSSVSPFAVVPNDVTSPTPEEAGTAAALSRNNKKNGQRELDFDNVDISQLELSYPIFQNGSIFGLNDAPTVGIVRAKKRELSSKADLSRAEVVALVARAYFANIWMRERVGLAERGVAVARERVTATEAEVAAALKLPQDVDVAKAQLAATRDILSAARDRASAAEVQLARLTGAPIRTPFAASLRYPAEPKLPSARHLVDLASALHPMVGVQDARIEKARQELRVTRSQMLPAVTMKSTFTYSDDFDTPGNHLFAALVKVDVPIFDWNHRLNATRQARELTRSEEARRGKVADDLSSRILDVYSAIQDVRLRLAETRSSIAEAEANVTLYSAAEKAGKTRKLEVLQSRTALINLQQKLSDQQYAAMSLYGALQEATGGTWQWLK